MAQYTSPMTDKVSVSFQPSTDNGTTAIEDVLDRQVCNGQYLRRQQSYTRQEPTYQHDDQYLIAFKQERLHHPKWQIWNRRPILQEMDTQEYDWVRLYIEKSPAKSFYSFTGDFAREVYLCVNKTNSLQIGLGLDIKKFQLYIIWFFLFHIKRILVLLENQRKVYSFGIPSRSISTSADVWFSLSFILWKRYVNVNPTFRVSYFVLKLDLTL